MKISKKTYVSDILKEYGDIAEIMELFGVKRVGGYGFRKFLTRFITVKTAAFVHRVPVDNFIKMVEAAIKRKKA
jgi:virulence-associated protein VapD